MIRTPKIVRATVSDLVEIVPLFDDYRVFYGQLSNKEKARRFLENRLSNDESIIFLAFWNEKAVGFTQLYTTYSSVSLKPFFILNDLFVTADFRGKGIGKKLLDQAKACCEVHGFKGIALETAMDNPAQQLYEKLDWKKDTGFLHYFWMNTHEQS